MLCMHLQYEHRSVRLATNTALERSLLSMRLQVCLQTEGVGKRLRTVHAQIRFLEGVLPDVVSVPLFRSELAAAFVAFVQELFAVAMLQLVAREI